jgi:transcriptional regulator with XRE-family HTH domain
MAAIGRRIGAERTRQGISMVAAAEAAGMSRVTWHRNEKGKTSVGVAALLAAAQALDLEVGISAPSSIDATLAAEPAETLPLAIELAAYPQLRTLAWQVGDDVRTLAPHEALGFYERNWRHVEIAALQLDEVSLIRQLVSALGRGPDV